MPLSLSCKPKLTIWSGAKWYNYRLCTVLLEYGYPVSIWLSCTSYPSKTPSSLTILVTSSLGVVGVPLNSMLLHLVSCSNTRTLSFITSISLAKAVLIASFSFSYLTVASSVLNSVISLMALSNLSEWKWTEMETPPVPVWNTFSSPNTTCFNCSITTDTSKSLVGLVGADCALLVEYAFRHSLHFQAGLDRDVLTHAHFTSGPLLASNAHTVLQAPQVDIINLIT